ncbi:hypothetical protein FNCV3_05000 [Fusobacterium nucleatum]|nr:hypothetical protein FNCV3_05000 [Fusobacterium nucleatum]BEP05875.1 hypothetical protein FNSV3_12220 [Fusobacterium nucleatum]
MKDLVVGLILKLWTFLTGFTWEQWGWMALAAGIVAYMVYNRKKYVQIFDNAVVYAETSFNYGDNLKKLDAAVNFIIERTNTVPFFARIMIRRFLSRKRMVDVIETTLQKFSNVFGTGRKVDIKGNEEDGEK